LIRERLGILYPQLLTPSERNSYRLTESARNLVFRRSPVNPSATYFCMAGLPFPGRAGKAGSNRPSPPSGKEKGPPGGGP
jgi:hypothetical protein